MTRVGEMARLMLENSQESRVYILERAPLDDGRRQVHNLMIEAVRQLRKAKLIVWLDSKNGTDIYLLTPRGSAALAEWATAEKGKHG